MWREDFSETGQEAVDSSDSSESDENVADSDIIMDTEEENSGESAPRTAESDSEEQGIRLRTRNVTVNYAEPSDNFAVESESDETDASILNEASPRSSSPYDNASQPLRDRGLSAELNHQLDMFQSLLNRTIDNLHDEREVLVEDDRSVADAIRQAPSNNEPEVKKENEEQAAAAAANALDDSDDTVCSICYEPFTSSSNHRIVAIKCGHIFGKECIERWLKLKDSKRRCPKCNQVSNKNDVRIIYAKLIAAVDTTELDQAKAQLEEERRKRLMLEQQVVEMKLDLGLKSSENLILKRQIHEKEELIKRFKSNVGNQVETNLNQLKMNSLNKESFTPFYQVDLKVEGCRLILIAEVLGYIVISQPTSPNSLMKGYGIKRIPFSNFSSSDFFCLHTAQIKDMALHPVDALLLTASLDKTVRLFNLITRKTMSIFQMEATPWCVSWNKRVSNLFYVGLNNGFILECDSTTARILKKTNTCLSKPIKLINFLSHDVATNRVHLLITSVNSSFFCDVNSSHQSALESVQEDSVMSNPLGITGTIMSSSIISDSDSGHILLTVRPSNDYPNNVQHYLLDFAISANGEIRYNLVNTFLAGQQSTHLINSKLFSHPDKLDSLLICSGDETLRGAYVWEKDNEKPIQTFCLKSVVFDIGLFRTRQSQEPILALLSEKHLNLYKWNK